MGLIQASGLMMARVMLACAAIACLAFITRVTAMEQGVNTNNMCLTSPGYPNFYPHNSNISQVFSVAAGQNIEITFQDLDVELGRPCRFDYVEFSDGNGNMIGKKLCGNSLPQNFSISTSTAFVFFHSDVNVAGRGFKFCYKPGVNTNNMCLTSPGYPNFYPQNSNISQVFSVAAGQNIEITFQDLDVELGGLCRFDYVEFSDGNGNTIGKKLCGNSLPQNFSISTSTASVYFHSDFTVAGRGFKFCYKPSKGGQSPQLPGIVSPLTSTAVEHPSVSKPPALVRSVYINAP